MPDLDYYLAIVERGAVVEMDSWGHPDARSRGLEGTAIDLLLELLHRGYERHVLLSHDVCYVENLKRFGGHGFTYLHDTVLPRLRERGVTEDLVTTLTVDNPARLLSFRPGAGHRLGGLMIHSSRAVPVPTLVRPCATELRYSMVQPPVSVYFSAAQHQLDRAVQDVEQLLRVAVGVLDATCRCARLELALEHLQLAQRPRGEHLLDDTLGQDPGAVLRPEHPVVRGVALAEQVREREPQSLGDESQGGHAGPAGAPLDLAEEALAHARMRGDALEGQAPHLPERPDARADVRVARPGRAVVRERDRAVDGHGYPLSEILDGTSGEL